MTKTYTEEFKRDAVHLVESSGRPKSQVARELGVSESALYRWIEQYGTDQSQPAPHTGQTVKELEAELKRLRRENEVLRQEREILKKAISIYSQDRR